MTKQMPEGWEPPYPAHVAKFDESLDNLVMAYFGVQHKAQISIDVLLCIDELLIQKNGPEVTEKAVYTDIAGYNNQVFICYWKDQTVFQSWMVNSFLPFWNTNAEKDYSEYGFWREIIGISTEYFETLFPNKQPAGIARLGEGFSEPVDEHGYYGGMRDRLPASSYDDLEPEVASQLTVVNTSDTVGKRIKVNAPGNLNLIRSAQDWSAVQGKERELYLNDVHPILLKGMDYLIKNPLDSGCCYMRFMTEVSADNQRLERTFGMGMFLSIKHLEAWSKSHPTHTRIFDSFIAFAQKVGDQMALNLWHEVSVLPKGAGDFQYLNCHNKTGLIPYFEAEEV
ncbi:MAG: phenylacetaldoxime dehydratase family protein [Porticoccaceae bacterium]